MRAIPPPQPPRHPRAPHRSHPLRKTARTGRGGEFDASARPLFSLFFAALLLPLLRSLLSTGAAQVEIRNSHGECLRIGIGSVGEHDDGQAVVWKALDRSAKSYCASIVEHALVAS